MKQEIIGDCRLILGDCLEVMPQLEAESVDMIWTDPPYGHKNNDGDLSAALSTGKIDGRAYKTPVPIANDDMDSMRHVVDKMLIEATRVLKGDCCCCCCCGGGHHRLLLGLHKEWMSRVWRFFIRLYGIRLTQG